MVKSDRFRENKKAKFRIKVVMISLAAFAGWYFFLHKAKAPNANKVAALIIQKKPPELPSIPVTKVHNTYEFSVDANPYYHQAIRILKTPVGKGRAFSFEQKEELCQVTAFLFLNKGMSMIDPKIVKSNRLRFIFESKRGDTLKVICRMEVTPDNLKKVQDQLSSETFEEIQSSGVENVSHLIENLSITVF